MRFSEFYKGNNADNGHDKMAHELLASLRQRHNDEFSLDDALDVYAHGLKLSDRHKLEESQRLHVGRLVSKLSKQHDVIEIADRYIFPKEKREYH